MHLRPTLTPLLLLTTGCFGKTLGEPDYGDCPDYIACSDATGTPTATLETEFGEGGICWDGSEDEQRLCRAQCTDAMDVLAEAYPDVEECGGGSESTPDFECEEDPEGTGYSEGDVSFDFTLNDQHGDPVSLYDYCGYAVILVVGTLWDPITTAAAPDMVDWLEEYQDRGLTVLVLIGEDLDGGNPTTDDLADWAEDNDLDTPVLADPGTDVGSNYLSGVPPSFNLMKPGAELVLVDQDDIETSDIESALP